MSYRPFELSRIHLLLDSRHAWINPSLSTLARARSFSAHFEKIIKITTTKKKNKM